MQNLSVKYGSSIQFVAVNMRGGGHQKVTDWINAMAPVPTFPILHANPNLPDDQYDWSIASLYHTNSISWPSMFIIGSDGTVKGIYDQGILYTQSELEGHVLDVVYTRTPVDVELVVDVSSSMDSPSPSNPNGGTKLALLKQAVNIVMDLFHDHGQANDTMGIVRFADNATAFEHAGKKLLTFAQGQSETLLRDEINNLTTGSCTAMGAGLQVAFDALVAEGTQKRFAILCTDGMQNIEPKVTNVSSHYEIIDSSGWLCGPHSSTPAHPGTDIKSYNTRIHTVGIGITANYEPLLQAIANQTKGFYRATHDPTADLDLIYAVNLCNCLAAGSPAVIRHAVGRLGAEQCEALETFSINYSVRKLSVALSWQREQKCNLTFWLRGPDGTLLGLHREMRTFDDHCIATIFLPKEQDGTKLEHVGTWTMIIRGERGVGAVDYHALIVGEDREIKWHVDYPRKVYAVGDILPLTVTLPESRQFPYRIGDLIVESSQLRVSPAELLAKYRASSRELERSAAALESSGSDPRALLHAKLRRIETGVEHMQDLLRPERTRSSLREATLQCAIAEGEVIIPLRLTQAGVFSYKVELLCESRESGPVERTDYVSVLVGAGAADPRRSSVAVARRRGTRKGAVITVTPRNARGHLIGPGLGDEIKVLADKGSIEAIVTDLVDGTYQVEILLARGNEDAQVTLVIGEETVWAGSVASKDSKE